MTDKINNSRQFRASILPLGIQTYNQTDKSWYVDYRLCNNQYDNYRTIIQPDKCVNVLQNSPLKNIGVDTSHNQIETAGEVVRLWNEIDTKTGILYLMGTIRYAKEHYITDKNGARLMSSPEAYEKGILKGVSIDFNNLESFKDTLGRIIYTSWSLNRIAVLTKLTADIPGQQGSGEVSSEFRSLTKNQNNNMSIIDNNTTQPESQARCLCDSQIGAFGRSNLDNSYIELLNIAGEGELKIFTLRNVLTGDEFTTAYDDHYNEITEEEVNNRLSELLNNNQESRSFDEVTYNELRACSACQAKMAERKKQWAEQMTKTREIEEIATAEVLNISTNNEENRGVATDANAVTVDTNNPVVPTDMADHSNEIEQLKTELDDLSIQVASQQSMIEQLTANIEQLTTIVDELKITLSTRTIEDEEINKIQDSMRKFVSESIENQDKNQIQKQKKSTNDLNAKLELFYQSKN